MMKILKLSLLLILLCGQAAISQTAPSLYYTFDGGTPLAPTVGTGNLSTTGTSTIGNTGKVGKYLDLNGLSSSAYTGGNVTATTGITFQFIFKPGYQFDFEMDPTFLKWGNVEIYFDYPNIYFNTTTALTAGGSSSHSLTAKFNGINYQSWDYYQDGNWHLMSFVWSPATGEKYIYVDGLLPASFQATGLPTGTCSPSTAALRINPDGGVSQVHAFMDEIAVYPAALKAGQIYRNYLDIVAGQHYTTALSTSIPAALPVAGPYDTREFAPGYVANSGNMGSITRSALQQWLNVPLPRFKPGHTALRNMNWMQLHYMGGFYQGFSESYVRDTSTAINKEMAWNWNYMISISPHLSSNKTSYNNPNKFVYKWIQLANQYPNIPASVIMYWEQMSPAGCNGNSSDSYITRKDMSANHYCRNSSGQFLNISGSVTTNPSAKRISPACPLDSIIKDGIANDCYFDVLEQYLTREISYVSENNEVIPVWGVGLASQDPAIVAQKGSTNWDTYLNSRKTAIDRANTQQWIGERINRAASFGKTFTYSEYAVYGYDGYGSTNDALRWQAQKVIQTPVNGRYLGTLDFYPLKPSYWYGVAGAYKGLNAFIEEINAITSVGDSFMAPFTNAGWQDPEVDVRASQWLGNMKMLAALGALRYQAAFFNTTPTVWVANPKGYVYQAMMPSYAQAVFTHVPFWENSTLMPGDFWVNREDQLTGPMKGFQYYSGKKHGTVIVRQNKANANQYLITSLYQRMTNMADEHSNNRTPTLEISLAGSTVKFKTREQGSVYIWNKTDSTLVQLDDWHERGDPNWWTEDFYLQAEVHDGGTTPVKTYNKTGYDYTNAYTVISYADTATVFDTLKYSFQPRNTKTYYLWIKARSRDNTPGSIYVRMDNGTQDTTKSIDTLAWYYYRLELTSGDTMKYSLAGDTTHILKLRVSNKKIEIDQIVLTVDSTLTFPERNVICGVSANIFYTDPLTFCQGGSVTLTATASSTYLWSTGATTQSINVSTAGSYSVTITDNTGCTGTSSPVIVTVNSAPTAPSLLVTGSACYGDSLNIDGLGAYSSYSWSTGATTSDIYVKTAGLYRLTVTDVNGCTNGSDTTISFQAQIIPQIDVQSSLGICYGDTIQLHANNASQYDVISWYNYPDTTDIYSNDTTFIQAFSVDDTVSLQVNKDGCSGISANYVIIRTVNCDSCEAVKNLRSANVLRVRATIRWSELISATQHVVYLTNKATNKTVTSTVEGSLQSAIFTKLTPATPYTYYVVTTCKNGETKTSTIKSFTTQR